MEVTWQSSYLRRDMTFTDLSAVRQLITVSV